jgi:hypothetical protein
MTPLGHVNPDRWQTRHTRKQPPTVIGQSVRYRSEPGRNPGVFG